ncbi:unnamed protein product, partial [Meganyctiphanes norvegica]
MLLHWNCMWSRGSGRCTPYQCSEEFVEIPGECQGSNCRCCFARPTTTTTTTTTTQPSCINPGMSCGPGGNGRCTPYQCSQDSVEVPGECQGSNCRCCCDRPITTIMAPTTIADIIGKVKDSCLNNRHGVCSAKCDNPGDIVYGQCNSGAICCHRHQGVKTSIPSFMQMTQPSISQPWTFTVEPQKTPSITPLAQVFMKKDGPNFTSQMMFSTVQPQFSSPHAFAPVLQESPTAVLPIQFLKGQSFKTGQKVPIVKLKVVVYYESLCSDCRRFFNNILVPAYKQLQDIFTIDFVPYGKMQTIYDVISGKPSFECQFGNAMCEANRVHACVVNTPMEEARKIDIINCMEQQNEDKLNPLQVGLSCFGNEANLWMKVSDCVTSEEADWLLESLGKRTRNETQISFHPSRSHVPFVTINGKEIADYDHFINALCNSYNGPKP